ncbi:MAG: SAM-dependent methyltransferase [Candidatus Omnitrophica bacterium]|nr:SAM-dependent methyltransferase [Candidatus Omnitrophota bacterium]
MPFQLNQIVPWGRSFDEYRRMFSLSTADLGSRILGVSDGPASFNSDGAKQSQSIVSCDPLYQFSSGDIRKRIDETFEEVLTQTEANRKNFVWESISDPVELGKVRMEAMEEFLKDFEDHSGSRYVASALPNLPFSDRSFDLALCSHFLFLYSEQLDYEFHVRSLEELLRVAREVRIFPLLSLDGTRSPHVDPLLKAFEVWSDLTVKIEKVDYEFQRGGNEMMRIS